MKLVNKYYPTSKKAEDLFTAVAEIIMNDLSVIELVRVESGAIQLRAQKKTYKRGETRRDSIYRDSGTEPTERNTEPPGALHGFTGNIIKILVKRRREKRRNTASLKPITVIGGVAYE